MADPYIGEIRTFAGNFAPVGWEFCDGRLLPIAEYDALFNLIGTAFGGDGMDTFALPDLRGRWAVGAGTNLGVTTPYATTGGAATVTLTTNQIPAHTHVPQASVGAATTGSPAGATWAASTTPAFAAPTPPATAMAADALQPVGGSQPHENRPPYLAVSFIISLYGIYPTPA